MNQSITNLELGLWTAMQRCIDEIVRAANADAALLKGSGMEKNQIRNVLNVAEESHSLAVVTNFIRYQLGRSRTGPAWQHPRGGEAFGLRVIEQIESPGGVVARQAKAVQAQVGEIPAEKTADIKYDLMRYYLGYLNRAFIYGKETQKWQDLGAAAKGD